MEFIYVLIVENRKYLSIAEDVFQMIDNLCLCHST